VGAALDFGPLKTAMARPTVIDLRDVYRPAKHGFIYETRRKANKGAPRASGPAPQLDLRL
jgi:hypothetical protein